MLHFYYDKDRKRYSKDVFIHCQILRREITKLKWSLFWAHILQRRCMFLGRLRQRKKKAPLTHYSLKLQTHISLSINELKVAGVSVAICELLHSRRRARRLTPWLREFASIENRNLQTSLLIVANRPDLGSVNKIFSSRSNTLLLVHTGSRKCKKPLWVLLMICFFPRA